MRKLFIDLEALQFRATDAGPKHCLHPNNPRDFQEINMIGVYDSLVYKEPMGNTSTLEKKQRCTFDGNQVIVQVSMMRRLYYWTLLSGRKRLTPMLCLLGGVLRLADSLLSP